MRPCRAVLDRRLERSTPALGAARRARPSRPGAPRSTPSTSSPSPTATPAPTSTSPSTRPSTRSLGHEAAGILGDAALAQECRALGGPCCSRPGATPGSSSASSCAASPTPSASARPRRSTPAARRRAAAGPTAARASVAHPVEGTILSVAEPVPPPRSRPRRPAEHAADLYEAAVDAARGALARTPEPAARRSPAPGSSTPAAPATSSCSSPWRSGCCPDAGDRGAGRRRSRPRHGARCDRRCRAGPTARPADAARATRSTVSRPRRRAGLRGDVPARRRRPRGGVAALASALDGLGDSLLVVGRPGPVERPRARRRRGRRRRGRHRRRSAAPDPGHPLRRPGRRAASQPVPLAVVACAAGPGLGRRCSREAGARGGRRGPRPAGRRRGSCSRRSEPTGSTAVIAAAQRRRHPAGRRGRRPGGRRARASTLHVVPARDRRCRARRARGARPRPLGARQRRRDDAAPRRPPGTARCRSPRKEALTWAGVCQPGDVLGIVDGDVAFVGTDLAAAAPRGARPAARQRRRAASPSWSGPSAEPGLGTGVATAARARPPATLEVVVIDGGQPVYPLLLGVE